MTILVDPRIPLIPNAEAYDIATSVASLQPTASALVHCMGWRFRPCVSMLFTYADTGTTYQTGTNGLSDTRHLRFRTTPLARHLYVAFVYQAQHGASGGCQIELNLYSTGGVLRDGPVTFDSVAGTLRTETTYYANFAGGFTAEYPHLQATTGTLVRVAGDDRVGMLLVPSTARGVKVELRAACTNARIRSMTVWEYPEQELGA